MAAVPEVVADPAALWLAPGALKPWPDNPRAITPEAVARVAASIKRFGFGAPIVARKADREIIAGHTRWMAARELELPRVPVRLLDVSAKQAHMLALTDNRYTELTGWSSELAAVLATFEPVDVAFMGWSADDIAEAIGEPPDVEGEADGGEDAAGASFEVCSAELIGEALAFSLHGKRHSDFAPPVADVMAMLNRCAAGKRVTPRIADRWFPHRYDCIAGKSPQTPNQALQDIAVIRGVAAMVTGVMKSWGYQRDLLTCALLYHGRQCARQFPLHVARDIYRELAPPGAAVLDPCAGWGGRLLGWACSKLGGSYHGIDASALSFEAFAVMMGDLNIGGARIQHAAFEDVQLEANSYDFAFTSPPYYTLERYGTDPEQAEVRYATYPAWRAGFLAPLIGNTLAALRPGCAFAVNVSAAAGNDIAKDVAELGREHGASVEHRAIDIGVASKIESRADGEVEDLLVLRKPEASRGR